MLLIHLYISYSDPKVYRDLHKCLKESCDALRKDRIDTCCHILNVFLLKEFEGKISCTIDDVIQKINASDTYPNSIQANCLCEIAKLLSVQNKIFFLLNKHSPEKSWIILDIDALINKVSGQIFATQGSSDLKHYHIQYISKLQSSQLERYLPGVKLDPSMIATFLKSVGIGQVDEDLKVQFSQVENDTTNLDSHSGLDCNSLVVTSDSLLRWQSFDSGISSISGQTTLSSESTEQDNRLHDLCSRNSMYSVVSSETNKAAHKQGHKQDGLEHAGVQLTSNSTLMTCARERPSDAHTTECFNTLPVQTSNKEKDSNIVMELLGQTTSTKVETLKWNPIGNYIIIKLLSLRLNFTNYAG